MMLKTIREFSTKRTANVDILKSALTLVPKFGWKDSIVESLRHNNLSDQGTALFSPDDLVKFHYKQQLERLKDLETKSAPGFDRLKELLLYRLDGNAVIGSQRLGEAIRLSLKSNPVSTPWECLTEVSDELWYLAGDRSTDTNWYTRRGSLLGVYAACEAFQARDGSRNFRDTHALAIKLLSGLENCEFAEKSVFEWLDFNARAVLNVAKTWR